MANKSLPAPHRPLTAKYHAFVVCGIKRRHATFPRLVYVYGSGYTITILKYSYIKHPSPNSNHSKRPSESDILLYSCRAYKLPFWNLYTYIVKPLTYLQRCGVWEHADLPQCTRSVVKLCASPLSLWCDSHARARETLHLAPDGTDLAC